MDNLTHSLTGALAAKVIGARKSASKIPENYERHIFWLLVIGANLPDIDVIVGLLGDPLHSIKYHRGITHSFLFAPILGLLPAIGFYYFSKMKDFRSLWILATIGIFIHIFFDLITGFGTRILSPLFDFRFSLDWMFIIDPYFTLFLLLMLILGRYLKNVKPSFTWIAAGWVVLYLIAETTSHSVGVSQLETEVQKREIRVNKLAVLPQPFSIFSWQGLVANDTAIYQTFFSVLSPDSFNFREYVQERDEFTAAAMATGEAEEYCTFARFPWVQSYEKEGSRVVEIRDLQFSVDEALVKELGFAERSVPFVLRYIFSREGELGAIEFDGKKIPLRNSER